MPRVPNAAAMPPTKLRRETVMQPPRSPDSTLFQRPPAVDPRAGPLFSYHRITPPAPVQTRSARRSPLTSTPTQLFMAAFFSKRRDFHSPLAGAGGAEKKGTPGGPVGVWGGGGAL